MNETEFETFYNEHSRPLWAYVRCLENNSEFADDIMQESFLKFLDAMPGHVENQKAYLYRIATNLVYDHFRRSKRMKLFEETPVNFHEIAYVKSSSDSGFWETFKNLQLQERALLWLAYVEGHEHKEIAGMLGIKPTSVRVLLFRARGKIAGLLREVKVNAKGV